MEIFCTKGWMMPPKTGEVFRLGMRFYRCKLRIGRYAICREDYIYTGRDK